MNVLLLTPYPHLLTDAIVKSKDEYKVSTKQPSAWPQDVDFIVSLGYRHIIKEPYLTQFRNRMVNVHISFLPWNRGADCNFWSWFEHTPKGVSIHMVDEGLDTGDIIAQMEVLHWDDKETLRSSYDFLINCASRLFASEWPSIRVGEFKRQKQNGTGSYHSSNEKDKIMGHLPLGWDTPVKSIAELGELVK